MRKFLNIIKYLAFAIIPMISVSMCRIFKLAQGEKNEEIVIGIFFGIVLDFIYSICLCFINENSK